MDRDQNGESGAAKRVPGLTRRSILALGGGAVLAAALPSRAIAIPAPLPRPGDSVSPAMEKLSAYMSEAADRTVPDEVREKAGQHILDTLAAIISGSALPPGVAALRFARAYGGQPVATVIASNLLLGSIESAMTNAMMAHADETDDSHGPSHAHLGCAVVPAALAVGEQLGISGAHFVRAVTLGYDVGARFTMALGGEKYENESHRSTHSIATIFGAAAAAGCAARLDSRQMRLLLGYTAQQCSGLTSWRRDTDHIQKAFVFGGMTARSGVTSALLVQSGWTGVEDLLSGKDNFFQAFDSHADPASLLEGLGERYEIARSDIKKWAVGSPIQAILDALAALLQQHPFDAGQVQHVTARLAPPEVITVDNRAMPDICAQHMVAVMLLDKTVSFAAAHDHPRMHDPAVLRERAKVELLPDPQLAAFLPTRAARVQVTLKDGTQLSKEVNGVRGTSKNPMSHDEVAAKSQDLMSSVLGAAKSRELINQVFDLEHMRYLKQLRPLLQP
ncbi:MAG TPA: MmgE/PrpD family protein [Terriglobales bacterium]|nr:MmgE/PrpD family protein [Terriglobales bacterium]